MDGLYHEEKACFFKIKVHSLDKSEVDIGIY